MELNLRGQAARRVLSLLAAVAVVMVWAIVVPHGSARADDEQGSGNGITITPIVPDGVKPIENAPGYTGPAGLISINDKFGYGWCIDYGISSPGFNPDAYTTPQKLTEAAPLLDKGFRKNPDKYKPVPIDGVRRDTAIYLVKEAIKAYKAGNNERAELANLGLQSLLTSRTQDLDSAVNFWYHTNPAKLDQFEKLTGYAWKSPQSFAYLEHTGNSAEPIPAAGPDEFITVIPPDDYSYERAGRTQDAIQAGTQRIIPVDQPGLDIPEDKPSETPTTTSETPTTTSEAPTTTFAAPTTTEPAPATTSEVPAQQPKPEPKHPKIATQAKLDGKDQVVAGATVNDTVKYKDLVPGKKYTLSASLVDKSDESKVLGKGTKEFTPSEANGEVVVPITVDQSVTEPVKAAVAFEELTSTEVNAEGEDSPKGDDTPETTSDDNQVADHKDINDEGQTVTSKIEPKHPKIATQAKLDGKDQVVAGATVNDTVKYKDLVPGKKYTLSASLVDKSDESKVLGKGTKEFTPDESDGEVVVPITVDQSVSEPVKAAVAFEELTSTEVTAEGEDSPKGDDTPETTSDDNQVADHKDINDEDQTVTSKEQPTTSAAPTTTSEAPTTTSEAPTTTSEAPTTTSEAPTTTSEVPDKHPEIKTEAKLDGKKAVVAGATVNDTVTYKDLVPGKKYTLSASLVDKSDESKVLGKGTKEFTPSEANGEVVVPITVDDSVTDVVKAAVAFEELTSAEVNAKGEDSPKGDDTPDDVSDDNQVADHKDINDENQTVTSEDQPTESAAPTTTSEAPTTTSEAPTTTSEAPATTTSEVPSESSEAPISTKKLAPTESAKPELPVSEVTPKIQTEAKFADKKEIVAGTVVNDTVTYTNLIPGKQYTLTAELMDKKDGTTVVGHGSVTFTPESTGGSVVVPITVDDSVTEVVPAAVAFETLTSTQVDAEGKDDVKGDKTPETKDDNQVAKHRDITDQKQTVTSDSAAERHPKIATEAKFENKKEIVAGTKINDTVMFEDLVPNTRYTLTAQLMDKKDGTTVLGHGSTSFIPTTSNGSVVVPITVDESVTEPVASAVAFESLTSTDVDAQGKQNPQGGDTPDDVSDDNQIAEHKDISDENQTVTSDDRPSTSEAPAPSTSETPAPSEVPSEAPVPAVTPTQPKHPKVETEARFANKKEIVAGQVINDTVRYSGLVPGKQYTLTAELMDKADGATVLGHGVKTFTPAAADGEVLVPITVDESVTQPVASAVAFETLTSTEVNAEGVDHPQGGDTPGDVSDDNQIGEHKDINDDNQTVVSDVPTPGENTPQIRTVASLDNSKEIVAGAKVNDTVTFEGLVPGKQYTLTAELMDKADGKTVVGHGSMTFTPETAAGEVVVPITVDDSVTEVVPSAVAFETLTSTQVDASGADHPQGGDTPQTDDDNQIAVHHDITDAQQTVTSDRAGELHPKVETEARFANIKELVAGTQVNDTVRYSGLVPGKQYTLTAELMDKADGATVLGHGVKVFTPDPASGEVIVPITVDESVTEPVASAVAFETLTSTEVNAEGEDSPKGGDTPGDVSDDNQIGEHKDINDDNQTVTSGESKPSSEQQVTPAAGKPGVPAGQGRGGQPSISTHAEIKDNGPLVEGAVVVDQVRFTGLQPGKKYTLEANLVCKADGQPTQARSTVEFVPNQADGKVNVPVSVTDAGCSEQVVFETLKDASGAVVATHHDITDADQTVSDHDQPGPNGPGDDQVTPDEGVTVLDQGGVPDSGAPLPADAGRQEIRSIPSGAAHLDAGMPLFI
ncbi:VaFE repeat-containing surface-anchored protein [Corynebacterium bovis]|uniref:VaFE repeat-containing surface-anchored protein n=1 Tax=Corynebacterium bovis TaxID=36808 RepID=UPI003139FD8A